MATCQNEQAAAFQREAHQIEEQEKWSPVKFTASTTQDLPNYSLGAENTPLTASSLYNNPYHPITAADRVLQPHSYQNSRSDSPNRPRLGRFLSFEPSISAREHASL